MSIYVLARTVQSDHDDAQQFWSNEIGWADLQSATPFTDIERRTMTPPFDVRPPQWIALPIDR